MSGYLDNSMPRWDNVARAHPGSVGGNIMFRNRLLVALCLFLFPVVLSAQGLDTAKIDEVLGRSGQKTGDVYRVGFPRTDLHVSIAGVEVRPGLALGSWAAFSGNNDRAITKPAGFVKVVEDIIGMKGTWNGGVLAFGIPRGEPVTEDGMTLTGPQGVAEAINFQEAGTGQVATTGDFVLIASEVNPVISALEAHNIEVTALHSHMLTEQPRLFFMHFWSVGSPDAVAQGIKAAIEKIKTRT
jgi:hypothetical protein